MKTVKHYRTKEEAEDKCNENQTVVMEGNAVIRYRIVDNDDLIHSKDKLPSLTYLKNQQDKLIK